MSYVFELQTVGGSSAYMVAQANTRDEALAHVNAQLALDDGEEVFIVAVHTVQ
jgi:hypothetical protein